MDYKKEIEKLLNDLKSKGIDREKVEKDIGMSKNYIDQALSRGGNKSFFMKIQAYFKTQNFDEGTDLTDQASMKVVIANMIKLQSKVFGRTIEDCSEEFERDTTLALNDLKKRL